MATAKRFEDLITWQLASEFARWAYRISESGPMAGDSTFRSQWRAAAASAPRNLAEGFAKFDATEFARYVNIARGSLAELQSDLRAAKDFGYLTDDEFTTGWRLLCRTVRATNRLHAYLRSCRRQPRKTRSNP